ncbi:MAG: methyltransferase [Solirubrobacterales bacterium]
MSAITTDEVTPAPIMELASGFMAAKHLFVASRLGLFEAIAGGTDTTGELASELGLPEPSVRISADAMVAVGMLEREDGRYRNSDVASAFLSGSTRSDLRPFLRFWDQISYPSWTGLETALRTRTAHAAELTAEQTDVFAAGVEAITAGAANALAHVYDFAPHRRLLDVGGGTGSFLDPVLAATPTLEATLVELPDTAAIARARFEESEVADRVRVIDADAVADSLPLGHDVVLVANFIHLFSPETNSRFLTNLARAVSPGARLLLVDFWTDPGHTSPPIAALLAGEFLLVSGEGDVYSHDDLDALLTDAGWQSIERRELAGPQSLVIAEAGPRRDLLCEEANSGN